MKTEINRGAQHGFIGLSAIVSALIVHSSVLAQVAAVQVASTSTKKVVAVVDTSSSLVVETKVSVKSTAGVWQESVIASTAAQNALIDEVIAGETAAGIINDCNNNGVDDGTELAAGAADWDSDGELDICETNYGDFNLNNLVDSQDVSILLGWWGIANPLFGDLSDDGVVDAMDLGTLLARFGPR